VVVVVVVVVVAVVVVVVVKEAIDTVKRLCTLFTRIQRISGSPTGGVFPHGGIAEPARGAVRPPVRTAGLNHHS